MTRALLYLRVSTAEQAHAENAAEGYSIPAQREACRRKAADLGAEVAAEFADRGESARSAARPGLQAMLARLAEQRDIDYVIVHKIDRLARNRADDVQIQLAIERAGAKLVSVSENVDDTPSGQLVRNIMADLAEFYSRNLAQEVIKGSVEKAKNGGTPGRAKLGYLNVRRLVDGHELRTVVLDSERAPLLLQGFELYATGDYSAARLLAALTEAGLRTRPTRRYPAKPLSLSQLHNILKSRYYLGYVEYRGIEYRGTHQPLVSEELFTRVQEVLAGRSGSGEKPRIHHHYLKGSLFCAGCGSRLSYTKVRGTAAATTTSSAPGASSATAAACHTWSQRPSRRRSRTATRGSSSSPSSPPE